MMPSGTKTFCQVCAKSGRQSRLKLYQINFSEAIELCENQSCLFLLESCEGSSSIQPRDLHSVPALKRRSARSIKSLSSTPLGTPSVLSPLSFSGYRSRKPPVFARFNGEFKSLIRRSLINSDGASVNGNSESSSSSPLNDSLSSGRLDEQFSFARKRPPQRSEELDLEGLLNSGAFDNHSDSYNSVSEPVSADKCVTSVNGDKYSSCLSDLELGLKECVDFTSKFVAKSPKNTPRNPLDELLDFDENNTLFPFDSELGANTTAELNELDFNQLLNSFCSHEQENILKLDKKLDNYPCDKLNNSYCTETEDNLLDEEVRSIFESNKFVFEENSCWKRLKNSKMTSVNSLQPGANESTDKELDSASLQTNDSNRTIVENQEPGQETGDADPTSSVCQDLSENQTVQPEVKDVPETSEVVESELNQTPVSDVVPSEEILVEESRIDQQVEESCVLSACDLVSNTPQVEMSLCDNGEIIEESERGVPSTFDGDMEKTGDGEIMDESETGEASVFDGDMEKTGDGEIMDESKTGVASAFDGDMEKTGDGEIIESKTVVEKTGEELLEDSAEYHEETFVQEVSVQSIVGDNTQEQALPSDKGISVGEAGADFFPAMSVGQQTDTENMPDTGTSDALGAAVEDKEDPSSGTTLTEGDSTNYTVLELEEEHVVHENLEEKVESVEMDHEVSSESQVQETPTAPESTEEANIGQDAMELSEDTEIGVAETVQHMEETVAPVSQAEDGIAIQTQAENNFLAASHPEATQLTDQTAAVQAQDEDVVSSEPVQMEVELPDEAVNSLTSVDVGESQAEAAPGQHQYEDGGTTIVNEAQITQSVTTEASSLTQPQESVSMVSAETYNYSALPFQTIENVPILEQEESVAVMTSQAENVHISEEAVLSEEANAEISDQGKEISTTIVESGPTNQISFDGTGAFVQVQDMPEGISSSQMVTYETVAEGSVERTITSPQEVTADMLGSVQSDTYTTQHLEEQQLSVVQNEQTVSQESVVADAHSQISSQVVSGIDTQNIQVVDGSLLEAAVTASHLPVTEMYVPVTLQGSLVTTAGQSAIIETGDTHQQSLFVQNESFQSEVIQSEENVKQSSLISSNPQLTSAPVTSNQMSQSELILRNETPQSELILMNQAVFTKTGQVEMSSSSTGPLVPTTQTSGSQSQMETMSDTSSVDSSTREMSSMMVPDSEIDNEPIQFLDKHCLNLFIQWQNKDAMCWLDVIMIILCNSPTIQRLFMEDQSSQALRKSVLSTLLKAYYQAQTLMQKLTAKTNDDYKKAVAEQTASKERQSSSSAASVDTVGLQNGLNVNQTGEENQQLKTGPTKIVNKISVKSMSDYFKAMEILDTVREKIWDVVQPRLQCERGKNDSPLFALPLLVREPGILKEKFKVKYKYMFTCDRCFYHQEDDHSKILPSFPTVPADFDMSEPSFVRSCFECKAPGKRMKMKFLSLPDMLLFHFKEGLPHSRFDDLGFTFGQDIYTVTAVIQYKNNPDHFVAWIRNGTGCQWMECDDLKSTLCEYALEAPVIPPSQVHIVMWEKNINNELARDLENTSVTNILLSCLRVLQPDVTPGSSVVMTPKVETQPSGAQPVKYILPPGSASKLPGILTLPVGSTGGLQTMKIMSVPSASSASGLLANVAELSGLQSVAPMSEVSGQIQQGTSTLKPIILQTSAGTSVVTPSQNVSTAAPQSFQIVQKNPLVSSAASQVLRVMPSGSKIVLLPQHAAASTQTLSKTVLMGTSSNTGTNTQSLPIQTMVTSTPPNLQYVEMDKGVNISSSGQSIMTTMTSPPAPNIATVSTVPGDLSKVYSVGPDGILHEVPQTRTTPVKSEVTPVKKRVVVETTGLQNLPTSTAGLAPKIVVKKKTESGEIVESVITDFDKRQSSQLLKALESLEKGDTTGTDIIRQLVSRKMGQPLTTPVAHPSPPAANVATSTISSPTPGARIVTKYMKIGDKLVPYPNTETPVQGRGRGKGRGRGRGKDKQLSESESRPGMTVKSPLSHQIVQFSGADSPVIKLATSGQTLSNTGGPSTPTQVVKILGSPKDSQLIGQVGKVVSTTGTIDPSFLNVAPQTVSASPQSVSPSPQIVSASGKKVTTLLASHLAQGGVLKKIVSPSQTSPASKVIIRELGKVPVQIRPAKSLLQASASNIKTVAQMPSTQTLPVSSLAATQAVPTAVSLMGPQTTVPLSSQTIESEGNSVTETVVQEQEVPMVAQNYVIQGTSLLQSPSKVVQSKPKRTETGHSPGHSSGPDTDVEVLSDADGSKSPTKMPKSNPVISVPCSTDAALLAKAIQGLVNQGVPIQQIQDKAFLTKLAAAVKSQKGKQSTITVEKTASHQQVKMIEIKKDELGKQNVQTELPKPVVPPKGLKTETAPITVGSTHVTSPSKVVMLSKEQVRDDPTDTIESVGGKPVIVKPGESYLEAVKPFLKLKTTEVSSTIPTFDSYKLKSEIDKEKESNIAVSGRTGFAPIEGQKKKIISPKSQTETTLVSPVPVRITKPSKTVLSVKEPIESLNLSEVKSSPSNSETNVTVTPTKAATSSVSTKVSPGTKSHPAKSEKPKSDIMVVEVSPKASRKTSALDLMADAAVSRIPVIETESELPEKDAGVPVKKDSRKSVLKRSFMDAFDIPFGASTPVTKQSKVQTGVAAQKEKDEKQENTATVVSESTKSRGTPAKETNEQKLDSSKPVELKSRRPRKSLETKVDEKPITDVQSPADSPPKPKGRGRPKKVPEEGASSPEETRKKPNNLKSPPSGTKPKVDEASRKDSVDKEEKQPVSSTLEVKRGRGRPPRDPQNSTSRDTTPAAKPKQVEKQVQNDETPSRKASKKSNDRVNSNNVEEAETPKPKGRGRQKRELKSPTEMESSKVEAEVKASAQNVGEIKYIGKYKIMPIERPNTRRFTSPKTPVTIGEKTGEGKTSPASVKSSPAISPSPKKRRGRPPNSSAKKAKLE